MAYQVRRRRRDEETALLKSPRATFTPEKTRRAPPQTPDSKKEEFRKYLEKSGVIDALTKGGGRRPEWCVRPHVSVRCVSVFARARSRGRRVVDDDVAAPPRSPRRPLRGAGAAAQRRGLHQTLHGRADGHRRRGAATGKRKRASRGVSVRFLLAPALFARVGDGRHAAVVDRRLSCTSFSTPALSRPRVRALSTPPPAQLRKEREDLRSTIDELNARLTEDKGDDA
jgi:hypothetical protein